MGLFSSVSSAISSGVDTVQERVSEAYNAITSPVSNVPVLGAGNAAASNFINSGIDATQASFDNLSNANPTQRALVGGPLLAPDVFFRPSYAQGAYNLATGDRAKAQQQFSQSGLSPSLLTQNSSPNAPAMPKSSVNTIEQGGIASGISSSVASASPLTKILLIGGVVVVGYFIYKKLRK